MTKERIPGTWAAAITEITDLIGVRNAALVANAAERTLYKWADPDEVATPPIAACCALDLAYIAAGGRKTPLFDLYAEAMRGAIGDQLACRDALERDIAVAAREMGEAMSFSLMAIQPGAGRRDLIRAMTETAQASDAVSAMKHRLTAIFRRGTGPRKPAGNAQL